MGVLYEVFVKMDHFIFLADFVVLDSKIDYKVHIIIGKPFLAISRDLVDVEY